MELEDGDAVGNLVYTIGKFVHGELGASKFRGRVIISFLLFVISFNSVVHSTRKESLVNMT